MRQIKYGRNSYIFFSFNCPIQFQRDITLNRYALFFLSINLGRIFSKENTDSHDLVWVLSQAETIITIVGPFGKSRQIYKITTIFTKKFPDSFVLKIKVVYFCEFTICWIVMWWFGVCGILIMIRIILKILFGGVSSVLLWVGFH